MNWGEWLAHIAMMEFFVALFAASLCGLIWAVAAPAWLPTLAFQYAKRLAMLALIPLLALAALVVWP
jgi:hypothetical protein